MFDWMQGHGPIPASVDTSKNDCLLGVKSLIANSDPTLTGSRLGPVTAIYSNLNCKGLVSNTVTLVKITCNNCVLAVIRSTAVASLCGVAVIPKKVAAFPSSWAVFDIMSS